MKFIAVSKSVRMSPRKVRLVADTVRGTTVQEALRRLSLIEKRARDPIENTLKSALANAANRAKTTSEHLFIAAVEVGGGPALKRYHPSTRGRVHPYKKRSSHIKVVLEEVQTHGTKS